MAELSLNTQFEGQQTPGVAPGLGGTEKKREREKQPRHAVYRWRRKPPGNN